MDKNLSDNEIKKALECCINHKCHECPAKAMFCSESIPMAFALDLINRLEEEINRLQAENEKLNKELKNLRTENKELKNLRTDLISLQSENEKWQGGYMTQKEEIANLEIELKAMRGAANSYKTENERLTHITRNLIGEIKAEAMTEFAERLKESAFTVNQFEEILYKDDIDNLLKEMVGK